MFKKITFIALAAVMLTGCNASQSMTDPVAQAKARATALLDASLWTVPYTIDGGEGVSFSLPEQLTYAGGGDTDTSSTSFITEKNTDGGDGDEYFNLTSFVLQKCDRPTGDCNIGEMVSATPKEVFEGLVKDYSSQANCSDEGQVAVGDTTGQLFSCDFPAGDTVLFYGSKGAYKTDDELRLLLGEKELSDSLFKNFLATFKVD